MSVSVKDISIRTELRSGDLGYIIYRHGKLYAEENGYGLSFEAYVAEGLAKFYHAYNDEKDRIWICENADKIVGCLVLAGKDSVTAQLRYFYLEPKFRGMGLGNKLMHLFIEALKEKGYKRAYLWTTNEQEAATKLYEHYGFKLTEEKGSTAFGKALIERKFELQLL